MNFDIAKKRIGVGGRTVEYFDEGLGKTILMVHGWIVGKESYLPMVARLRDSYRTIALDLPGFGGSELVKSIYDEDNLIDFIDKFVKKLKIGKVDYLVGMSLGGAVCLRLAIGRNWAKRLVLIAPLYTAEQTKEYQWYRPYLPVVKKVGKTDWIRKPFFGIFEKRLARQKILSILKYSQNNEETREIIRLAMDSRKKQNHAAGDAEYGLYGTEVDLKKMLPGMKKETLVLWGEGDTTLNWRMGEELTKLMPNSSFKLLTGGDHSVLVEKPDEICKEIREFLG